MTQEPQPAMAQEEQEQLNALADMLVQPVADRVIHYMSEQGMLPQKDDADILAGMLNDLYVGACHAKGEQPEGATNMFERAQYVMGALEQLHHLLNDNTASAKPEKGAAEDKGQPEEVEIMAANDPLRPMPDPLALMAMLGGMNPQLQGIPQIQRTVIIKR